ADLRVAPASPGKAERLTPLLTHPSATIYVNLEEANLLMRKEYSAASEAAQAIVAGGAFRCLVTDGGKEAAVACKGTIHVQTPPDVMVTRVTGAGDTFMAAHIAAECDGADEKSALEAAITAAARYVSGETAS
ncbi:MAG: PfkB family carbohydrate kinase, partial [Halocynthiibacter sp.]